jgi:hypothetical protein
MCSVNMLVRVRTGQDLEITSFFVTLIYRCSTVVLPDIRNIGLIAINVCLRVLVTTYFA